MILLIYFWLYWDFSACLAFSLVAVHGLLIAGASLVAKHKLFTGGFSSCASQTLQHRLNSCGSRAGLLLGLWNLPRPGIELVSPASAGGFFTTEPLGMPPFSSK